MDLKAFLLRFDCRPATEIVLPPFKGSTVRGALFSALSQDFCLERQSPQCPTCRARQACPVSALLSTVDEQGARGLETARPCTIEPPLEMQTRYRPDGRFSFGVTLFGEAWQLLAYVIVGVQKMGQTGIGNQRLAPGRFVVEEINAVEPVSGQAQRIYSNADNLVRCPEIPVTHPAVLSACQSSNPASGVTLEFLTPARLVIEGTLVKRLTFPIFMRRVLRRLTDLTRTATGSHPGFDHEELLRLAEGVRVAEDRTRWADVPSWSSRQGRFTPIGGLVGEITFEGDLAPFAPWLLWGTITHVGKDATKGGGLYRLRWPS